MFAPLRPSASVVVSIHLLGRSLTVFAEHEIKGKAVGKTIEAELLQSSIPLLILCPLDLVTNENRKGSGASTYRLQNFNATERNAVSASGGMASSSATLLNS